MRHRIRKPILLHLFLGILFCIFPAISGAVVIVPTKVVTGNIIQQNADHSVRLDNGEVYSPSRPGLAIALPEGKAVTLRYFIEGKKNFFFEHAPGLNSLQAIMPTPPNKDTRPK